MHIRKKEDYLHAIDKEKAVAYDDASIMATPHRGRDTALRKQTRAQGVARIVRGCLISEGYECLKKPFPFGSTACRPG